MATDCLVRLPKSRKVDRVSVPSLNISMHSSISWCFERFRACVTSHQQRPHDGVALRSRVTRPRYVAPQAAGDVRALGALRCSEPPELAGASRHRSATSRIRPPPDLNSYSSAENIDQFPQIRQNTPTLRRDAELSVAKGKLVRVCIGLQSLSSLCFTMLLIPRSSSKRHALRHPRSSKS